MNKHQAMFDFMETYPKISSLFSFSFAEARAGRAAMVPIDDETVSKDILGNEDCVYNFAIAEYHGMSADPFSNVNIEKISAVDDFIEWVQEQNRIRNYPKLGEGCFVEKIEAVRANSPLAAIDPARGIAKYMFMVEVYYEKLS